MICYFGSVHSWSQSGWVESFVAGVAVPESIEAAGHGSADYLLYLDKVAVGVIEAKPEGTPLSEVEWQSAAYAKSLPADVRLKAAYHRQADSRSSSRRRGPRRTTPAAPTPIRGHVDSSPSCSP